MFIYKEPPCICDCAIVQLCNFSNVHNAHVLICAILPSSSSTYARQVSSARTWSRLVHLGPAGGRD